MVSSAGKKSQLLYDAVSVVSNHLKGLVMFDSLFALSVMMDSMSIEGAVKREDSTCSSSLGIAMNTESIKVVDEM